MPFSSASWDFSCGSRNVSFLPLMALFFGFLEMPLGDSGGGEEAFLLLGAAFLGGIASFADVTRGRNVVFAIGNLEIRVQMKCFGDENINWSDNIEMMLKCNKSKHGIKCHASPICKGPSREDKRNR